MLDLDRCSPRGGLYNVVLWCLFQPLVYVKLEIYIVVS